MSINDSKNRVSVRRLYSLLNNLWTQIKNKFNTKVDKVNGKGLSTNDYTNDEKSKVAKAYQKPQDGIPSSDLVSTVQTSLDKADSAYQKPSSGIPENDLSQDVQDKLNSTGDAYIKPADGIPSSDMTQEVQESLSNADNAYQKPNGGIPASDLNSEVQQSLSNSDSHISNTDVHVTTQNKSDWNAKYDKPNDGIPTSDLSLGIQSSLSNADTAMQSIGSSDSSSDISGTEKIAINVDGKNVVFSTIAKLWSYLKSSKLVESTTDIGGNSATTSAAKSGSTLETQLNQKELASNKKQSVDVTSETDYPSSKAMAEFVNSSVSFSTANYISDNGEPFNSVQDLEAYSGTVTNNDYAFVTGTDQDGNTYYDRYKATVDGSTVTWGKEFRLNNSSFTQAQWAAISSNITSALVTSYNNHLANNDIHVTTQNKSDWNAKYDKPQGGIPSTDLSQGVNDLLSRIGTQSDWNQSDSSADDYIKNKPEQLSLNHDSYVTISETNGTVTIGLNVHTDTYDI